MIKQGNDKVNRIFYRGTDDVARAEMGGDWRMPTESDFKELFNYTNVEFTTYNGRNGCRYLSSNGNSIFIPCCGTYTGSIRYDINTYGCYWVNSWSSASQARRYDFYRTELTRINVSSRYIGRNIRAVSTTNGVDLGLPSGLRWAECNVGATQPQEIGNYYAWGELSPKTNYSWSTYKFNPSGDGQTMTKYNSNDGKQTLELDCECEIEKVMQGGDVIFFKPIYYTKDLSSENLSLVSACAVLDALQEVSTHQTITFSAYTSALITEDDTAMEKVMSAMEIGWNIVLN